jgi:predicted Ser/Thr protein kinase
MTAERWEQVKTLFEAALPEQDRGVFLDRQCCDPEVRQEVLRLLNERDQMESGFLRPSGQTTLLDRAARSLADQTSPRYVGQLVAGRYFVEREIGRGGIGVVYLAQDRQLHFRNVVLKFLHGGWEEHERVQVKFRQEIEALSRIHHPGVVGVLNVGHAEDGRSFLVMEYVEGATLRSLLAKGPIELSQVREIVRMVCDALDAAHQNGIFHRDLKPENIMIASSGSVKLIDFGIAKVQNSGIDAETQTMTAIGTACYVAPEQLMGRSELRSDIYALGVVCYEMLTGNTPFHPETPFHLYELQRSTKVPPPSKTRRDVSKEINRAILRALSFRPELRQISAKEFANEFNAVVEKGWLRVGKRIGAWAAAVALIVAIIVTGWNWVERRWEPSVRSIEFVGGREPDEIGFQKHLDLVDQVVYNKAHTGFDAIRLLSGYQGFYYYRFSRSQQYAAMRHGWSVSATIQPIQGVGSVNVDLGPQAGRYDIHVFLDPTGRQVVQLTTQIEKGLDGLKYKIEGPADVFHDYQLIYDPGVKSAHLLVDGVERLRGYSGHREYMSDFGLMFGLALYHSDRAEAIYKRVRFEISP